MDNISFDISAADNLLVKKIVARGRKMDREFGNEYTLIDAMMDVTATHANGNPLRLRDWLNADDFNFAHDWYGIRNCLDRSTAQMMNHFSPRFSARVDEEAA